MRPRRDRLLLVSVLALSCGPGPGETAPLLDGVHAPLILHESALLDQPPAYSPNRFVAGWWPGGRRWSPSQINVGDRPMMEAVFLDGRERRLAMRMALLEAPPGATFAVRIGATRLPPQPLVRDAEVPLPGGLPTGRLPIELDLRGSRVEIEAAGFGHAWPPGEIELQAESILQGGYSAIDFPRRLAAPARLLGRFEPPAEPEADQRFALLVETDESGSEVAFEWRPDSWRAALGARRLRLELPAGFVRIRLLAQGLGPPARWLSLAIAGGGVAAGAAGTEPQLAAVAARVGTALVATSERYRLVRAPGLGLSTEPGASRDAEYLFDLRRDPDETTNLAGTQAVEVDWLRSRLEAWVASREGP